MAQSIRYWVIRTHKENAAFINEELRKGDLRQGWGGSLNQNLEVISNLIQNKQSLTDNQRECWRGNRKLLATEGIRKDDIILLPNLPTIGQWLLGRVLDDEYEYRIDLNFKDYGHIRHVKIVGSSPVNPHNARVAAPLRSTMACSSRMWNIDYCQEYVDSLVTALESGKDLSQPSDESQKLMGIYNKLVDKTGELLPKNFYGKEIEPVIQKVLARVYGVPVQSIENKKGRADLGADIICRISDPLGLERIIVVQIKMGGGTDSWSRALEQIKRATSNEQFVSGAIIFNMERKPKDIDKSREELENEINIPIRLIGGDDLARIVLQYFPNDVTELLEDNEQIS